MEDKIFPAGSEYLASRYFVAMLNSSPTLATIIKYKDGSWGIYRGNRIKAHNFKYRIFPDFPMRITERSWDSIDAGIILAHMRNIKI